MKKLILTQGMAALVDDKDYEYLSQWKWHAIKQKTRYYAARNIRLEMGRRTVRLHRFLMNTPENLEVDHRDGNGLNNQRSNLRVCKPSENARNRRLNSDNTSGFKGVYWYKAGKKWRAQITAMGKQLHLGAFATAKEAAKVYDQAAKELHGQFANLNFNK